jgi:hypothetical protein
MRSELLRLILLIEQSAQARITSPAGGKACTVGQDNEVIIFAVGFDFGNLLQIDDIGEQIDPG